MNELAKIILAITELIEAEGRALRHGTIRTLIAAMLCLTAGVAALIGVAALAWAAFLGLSAIMPRAAALGLMGLVVLLSSGVILWTAQKLIK